MYYIISFKLDLKHKFNNNNILILNTIYCNKYSTIVYYIFNIEQLVQHDSNCIINIIMITIVVQSATLMILW